MFERKSKSFFYTFMKLYEISFDDNKNFVSISIVQPYFGIHRGDCNSLFNERWENCIPEFS